MRFKTDATVKSADGQDVGHLDRVVIDPQTNEISHLVVRKGWLFTEDKVMPIDMVALSTEDNLTLHSAAGDLEQLANYQETHYWPADQAPLDDGRVSTVPATGYAPTYYWYPPFGGVAPMAASTFTTGMNDVASTRTNVPEGTVALKDGAKVIDRDEDHVGDVEQVLIGSQADRATHFVISQGLLLKTRKLVPTSWVQSYEADRVKLAVDKDFLNRLPEYEEERERRR